MSYPKKRLTGEEKKQQRFENILTAVLQSKGKWVHLPRYCVTKHQTRKLTDSVENMVKLMGLPYERRDHKIKVLQ